MHNFWYMLIIRQHARKVLYGEYTTHSSKYIRRWQYPEKEIAISTMQNYSNYEFNRCGKTNFRCLVVRPGSSDGRASDLEIRRSQSRNLPGSFVSSIKHYGRGRRSRGVCSAPRPGWAVSCT